MLPQGEHTALHAVLLVYALAYWRFALADSRARQVACAAIGNEYWALSSRRKCHPYSGGTLDCDASSSYDALPILRTLAGAEGVRRVLELGTATVVTTFAFLAAFPEGVDSVDLRFPSAARLSWASELAAECGRTSYRAFKLSSLDLNLGADGMPSIPDVLFVDTWHTNLQLAAELEQYAPFVRRFIALHDTSKFAFHDESTEGSFPDPFKPGYTGQEAFGLWPAVEDFLEASPAWKLIRRCFNNNGLTILARIQGDGHDYMPPDLPACNETMATASRNFLNSAFRHTMHRLTGGLGGITTLRAVRLWIELAEIVAEILRRSSGHEAEEMSAVYQRLDVLHVSLLAEAAQYFNITGRRVDFPPMQQLVGRLLG